MYHLMNAKSERWNKVLSRVDYGGIAFAIFGGNLPIIYYGLACESEHLTRYVCLGVYGALCLGCFITTLIDKFETPVFRPIRALLFLGDGLSTIVTFLVVLLNQNENKMTFAMTYYVIGAITFIGGATIYGFRCPERCSPGTFDLCGASH